MTFGDILREARERKGYDLSTAARRLRIRPDILRAIEEDDFSRMPPRGYARNMVNAYARLLGLNPTEITRMYLDEAYAYQVGRARSSARSTGFDMGGSSRTKRGRERSYSQEEPEERLPRQNAFGRTLYDDRTAYSRSDYGQRGVTPTGVGGRLYAENRTHTSRHSALPTSQYTNFYAGPKAPNGLQSKLPFIIGGVIILILLVVVISLAFGNKGSSTEDVPNVPVTGLNDTTQGDDAAQGSEPTKPVVVAPTKAVLEYEVAAGQQAWIELYEDGSTTPSSAGIVEGPKKETVEVTGILLFSTPAPGAVTLTVDGEPVELTDSVGAGVYSYTVDFNAILEQWRTDNPTASPASSGDAANQSADPDTSTTTGDNTQASGGSAGTNTNTASQA